MLNKVIPKGKTSKFVVHNNKRNKVRPTWTISDNYALYKQELGELALSKTKHNKILKEICQEISKDLIQQQARSITLPFRLGPLSIKKRKNSQSYNSQRIDFNHYNKTGNIVYHCNFHTNKYYFFWDWNAKEALFTNKTYYKFVPARGNDKLTGTRGLANWIKYCATNPNIKDYDALTK